MTEQEWKNGFIEVVNILMRKKNIDVKELASLVGISESSMYRYMKGKRIPNAYIAQEIMNALK